jgi:antitoxin component YwqK of YwqJK toxin-antitoxin module
MEDLRKKYIEQIFTDYKKFSKFIYGQHNIWLSGTKGEGECKRWWSRRVIDMHGYYKNGNKIGEFKRWNHDGSIFIHSWYNKNGKLNGEYKEDHGDGIDKVSYWYKNGGQGEYLGADKKKYNLKNGYMLGGDGKYYPDKGDLTWKP